MIEFADPATLSLHELDSGSVFAPRFDALGLIHAVTVDASSSEVLMVAFMNADALRLTLETGFVHYYSRSRQKIWKKGETSGETQSLVELQVDCDQDTLVVHVRQNGRGASCHTGRRSCFFRRVAVGDGGVRLEDAGIPTLFDPKEVYSGG